MEHRRRLNRAASLSIAADLQRGNCLIESLEQRMLLTTVTPTQWMDAQVAPNMNPANTLPTLSTFWPYAANVTLAQEMADRWGYNLKWNGYLTAESVEWAMHHETTSANYQIAMLVKNNPGKYKLSFALSKEYSPGVNNELHPEASAHDVDGNSLPSNSPEMPDWVMQQWAMARADGILALQSYGIPVNGVILNSGEYGPGFDEATAMKDPAVAAARGDRSWLDYINARSAHYARIITDAVRAVTPDRQLLIMYTANPARDRGTRWPQSLGDSGTYGYRFGYPWSPTNTWPMQSWSDVPAGESYYRFGWGSSGYSSVDNAQFSWDMLSMEMNSFAQQQALGQKRSYYWLDSSHSDTWGPHAPKYDYMGYLKTLYTAGMLGAVEQTYGQGAGFDLRAPDASFDDAAAPRWLQSFTWQSQVYGEFTWLNDFISNSDLLPGTMQQKYSWDLPAYEFAAVSDNDRDVRILVRQAKDGAGGHKNDWLVTAWWASDTATELTSKEVQVDIPGLGIVSVMARNAGSVYRIRKNTAGEIGIQFLDPNADVPSQNFTASGNVAPVALALTTHTQTSTAKGIKLGVTDDNADLLSYTIVTQPGHGSLSGSGANLTYTPTAGWTGTDSFTYKANDGTVDSNIASVSLTVAGSNSAPVATAQSVTTLINTGKAIQLAGTDANGDILTYTVTGNPAHGTLGGSNGNWFYTPADNWFGSDSFSFVANDGAVNSSAASVAISIAAPTVLPTATINTTYESTMYKRPDGNNTPQRAFILSLLGNTVNYPVVVNYTVTGGTAVSGVDYKPLSGRVVFRPGDLSLAIMTNVYDDADGNKTLSVQLSPSSVYALGTATTTETIYNDERPTVFGGTSVSVNVTRGETGGFGVYLKPTPTRDLVVYFTVSGSAVEGVDYILPKNANHQLLIKANTTFSVIPVLALNNGLVNGTKQLDITLTPDSSYYPPPWDWATQWHANILDNPAGVPADAPYAIVRPGSYDTPQVVSLASRTAGASIRYTLDGSTPSATNGILYTGSFTISFSTTVRAYAYKSGLANSGVIDANYRMRVAPPTAIQVQSSQLVTLSTTTPGASIYYTTDYTPPVTANLYPPSHGTLYTGPFVIADPTRVRAVAVKAGLETSDQMGLVAISTQAPPTTPAGLTAVANSTTSINLSWTDSSSDETGFRIDRATDSGFSENFVSLAVGANVTTYSATGLNAGTTYFFHIRATRAGVDSSNSNSANATTQAVSTVQNAGFESPVLSGGGAYIYNPIGAGWAFNASSGIQRNGSAWGGDNAPEGVQAAFLQGSTSAISQNITLAAGSYIINFQAARRGTQIQPIRISVDGVQVGSLITPVSGSFAAYSSAMFTVGAGSHAIMLHGTASGDLSSFVDMIALEVVIPLPAAPTNLTATTVSSGQINLAWTDNSSNETGFKLERATDSGFIQNLTLVTTAAGGISYSDTGLLPGTTYYYRVRATNTTGDSSYSNPANASTQNAAIQNAGFETPVLSGGGSAYQHNPIGAGWIFNTSSGIQRNGSVWGAANAPEGSQTAFLQYANSAISQTLNFAAGSYTINFQAARRTGQIQPIRISVDGTQIGSLITPAADSFAAYSSVVFTVAAGNHTIMMQGTVGTAPDDGFTSFVDKVSVDRKISAINIDFVGWGNTGYTGVGVAPDTGTVWNKAGPQAVTGFLDDSTGAPTNVKFATTIGAGGRWWEYGGPNGLLTDHIYTTMFTPGTFDITGLAANTAYDLYIYSSSGGMNNSLFTIGTQSLWMTANNAATGVAPVAADWAILTVTSDGTGKITGTLDVGPKYDAVTYGANSSFSALQIVGSMATLPATTLAAPSGLTGTPASTSQINLTWTDNSNNETGFRVERATDSGFTPSLTLVTTTAANATSYSDTGLSAGTTYYYRIRATNGNGDSVSIVANATTVSALPGDFNLDSTRNAADIDLLFAAIRSGTNPAAYDLTGGGLVNSADTDQLILTLLGTRYGDFNLDHKVNLDDASLQLTNWQGSDKGWAQGDCTGDGRVNLDDASLLLTNWGWVAPAPAAPAAMAPATALVAAEPMAEQSVAPLAGDSVNASAVAADPVPAGLAGETGGVVVAVAPVLPVVTVAPVAVTVVPVVRTGEAITWGAPVELAVGTALSGPSSTDRVASDAGVAGVVTVGGGGNDTVYGDGVGDMLLAWDGRGDVSGGEPTEVGTTTRATTEWLLQGGAGGDSVEELLDVNMQVEGLLG